MKISPERSAPSTGLDRASKTVLRAWAAYLCILATLVFLPYLRGDWPVAKSLDALQFWLSTSALSSVLLAQWRNQAFSAGSLNAWDEAIAFWGLARLVHFMQASPS